ncbi:hypothetical protein C8Q74DRAFT_1393285, partial [Fomes fomentarius]
ELPHLAVEIQLKVYSYLDPRDLLVLARTCRQFRAFFLHRSNEPLWRAAGENAGNLPPCPPFMSESAFLNLLFSTYCQNCGRPGVWKVMWAWFAWYCPKCVIALSYTYNEARDKMRNVDRQIQHKALTTPSALLNLFGAIEGQAERYYHHNTWGRRYYHHNTGIVFRLRKTHVDSFIQALDQLAKPITDEARSQVIGRQKAYIAPKLPYIKACKDWHDKRRTEWADRLEAKRCEHFTEIVTRLNERGWDQEVELIQYHGIDIVKMEALQVVRQPSRLTPKCKSSPWEKVFKAIYPMLQLYRHKRLVKECTGVFRPRFAALQAAILAHYVQLPRTAHMDYHPDSVDLALMDECRAIADVPADQTVTQEDFARVVPELAARWEQERKKELTEAVIARLPKPPPDDVDILGLGIAIFECSTWPSLRTYKAQMQFRKKGRGAIHCGIPGRYLGTTLRYLSEIMHAMGLDPLRTTQEELDTCPARLGCRPCEKTRIECNEVPPFSKTYSSEAALDHTFDHHYITEWMSSRCYPLWELADTSVAGEPEGALSLMTPGTVWACSLCMRWDGRGDRMKIHLMEKHEIEYSDNCIKDGTIYLHQSKSTVHFKMHRFVYDSVLLPHHRESSPNLLGRGAEMIGVDSRMQEIHWWHHKITHVGCLLTRHPPRPSWQCRSLPSLYESMQRSPARLHGGTRVVHSAPGLAMTFAPQTSLTSIGMKRWNDDAEDTTVTQEQANANAGPLRLSSHDSTWYAFGATQPFKG